MENTIPSRSGRVIRALLAGGILAGGWFVVDMITSPEPAAAAAQIDLIPSGESPVSDLVDTVVSIAPIVAPVMTAVTPTIDPVIDTVDAAFAPLAPVTTPILTPVRDAAQPVIDTVVAPVLEGTLEAITPVIAPVVDGLVPTLEAVVSVIPTAVATVTHSTGILSSGSAPVASMALLGALVAGAASMAPGGPLSPGGRSPLAPEGVSPTGFSFFGEILSWMPAAYGTAAPATAAPQHPHASPVFASDTTPD